MPQISPSVLRLALSVFICIMMSCTAAGPATLLKDIMPDQPPADSDASGFIEYKGILYYRGFEPATGVELWRTDGTEAGTWLVKDIYEGATGSNPEQLTVINDELYFLAKNTANTLQLWKSDGSSSGTVRQLQNYPYSRISKFHNAGDGSLYLVGQAPVYQQALLISDGTASGTTVLMELPGTSGDPINFIGTVGKHTLFTRTDDHYENLWRTDGTPAGTTPIGNVPLSPYHSYGTGVQFNDHLYFLGNEGLWKSDGSDAGTILVKKLGFPRPNPQLVHFNDCLYLSAGTSSFDVQVWKSDGTNQGTVPVSPMIWNSVVSDFTPVGDLLFYTAESTDQSREVWRTDGTPAGTFPLTTFNTQGSSEPVELTASGDTLFFRSYTDGHLYKSNGTVQNTVLVKTFSPAPGVSSRNWPTAALRSLVVFTAGGKTGRDLWISDGTVAGTNLVYEPENPNSSNPGGLIYVGNKWFFHADDGVHGRELWVSDGTPAGTRMVRDILPGKFGSIFSDADMVAFGDQVYFPAATPEHGRELWTSDGTESGTFLVKDIEAGFGNSNPQSLISSDNEIFFSAYTWQIGRELWKSDGSDLGTTTVTATHGFINDPIDIPIVAEGNAYYFAKSRQKSPAKDQMYITDGTVSGTILLAEFPEFSAPAGANPPALVMNNTVFFSRYTFDTGTELWKTDGSAGGTGLVIDIVEGSASSHPNSMVAHQNLTYFHARAPGARSGLWKSDGTDTGTTVVLINPTGSTDVPTPLAAFNRHLLFAHWDGGLWKTDGSALGSAKLGSVYPEEVTVINSETILFRGDDGIHGSELWQSDGTAEGTSLVQDIYPNGSSTPMQICPGEDRVLFTADDGFRGRELWVLKLGDMQPADVQSWELYD